MAVGEKSQEGLGSFQLVVVCREVRLTVAGGF